MRLLDLYCGAGGCSVGYHRAGFEVVGVDIEPQPNYPYKFIQMDAIEFLKTQDLSQFDVIHASPLARNLAEYNHWGKPEMVLIKNIQTSLHQQENCYRLQVSLM